jgi:hypothetical protein
MEVCDPHTHLVTHGSQGDQLQGFGGDSLWVMQPTVSPFVCLFFFFFEFLIKDKFEKL